MYMREGEKSLDGFYRAWHPVEFYRCVFKRCGVKLLTFGSDGQCFSHRYLRFFPNGQVIMLTTSDDPLAVVHRLHNTNTRCSWFPSRFVPTWWLQAHNQGAACASLDQLNCIWYDRYVHTAFMQLPVTQLTVESHTSAAHNFWPISGAHYCTLWALKYPRILCLYFRCLFFFKR